jgi:hypothetical protein
MTISYESDPLYRYALRARKSWTCLDPTTGLSRLDFREVVVLNHASAVSPISRPFHRDPARRVSELACRLANGYHVFPDRAKLIFLSARQRAAAGRAGR